MYSLLNKNFRCLGVRGIFFFVFFVTLDFLAISQKKGCVNEAEIKYKQVYKYIEIANEYSENGKYDKEKKFALKAVKLTKKIQNKYKCWSPAAYWKLVDSYLHLGDFTQALETAKKSYQLCENFKDEDDCNNLSVSKMKIGNVYLSKGEDSLASIEYQDAIRLCKNNSIIFEIFLSLNIAEIEISNKKFDLAESKIEKAITVANYIGSNYDISQVLLGRAYYLKGIMLFELGKCEDALSNLLSSLQLLESVFDNRTLAKSYFYIGKIYHNNSQYEDALINYNKSIKISELMKYHSLLIDTYVLLSEIYFYQGYYDKSFILIEKAINLSKVANYKKGLVNSYNAKSFYFGELNRFDEMFSFAKSSLTLAEDIKYLEGLCDAYNNIETYYEKKKDYTLSKEYAIKTYLISKEVPYVLAMVDALNDIGDHYFFEGKNDSALFFYNQSLLLSNNGNYKNCGKYIPGKIDAYYKIANVYRKKNKKDKAFENYFYALELSKEIKYFDGIINAINGIRMTKGYPPLKIKKTDKHRKSFLIKLNKGQKFF